MIYGSVADANRALEPIDIRHSKYDIFMGDGGRVQARVEGSRDPQHGTIIFSIQEPTPESIAELITRIDESLGASGTFRVYRRDRLDEAVRVAVDEIGRMR